MGGRSCELDILWSNLVRELRNNKYMGDPDLLNMKEVKSRYLERVFVPSAVLVVGKKRSFRLQLIGGNRRIQI